MGKSSDEAPRLFGTDGMRGVANKPPMTVEVATEIGKAVGYLFRNGDHQARVVIGKDTRVSGYMFETAIAAGVCSVGADVWLCGPLPTPAIAHLTSSMRADAGIVISASHNPYHDNGIKIFAHNGFKLPDEREREIERWIAAGTLSDKRRATDVGKAFRIDDARGRYIAYLKGLFARDLTLDGVRIVVDCAHGAAYRVAPAVFRELGATVFALGDRPNGRNINDRAGALHPQHAAKAVAAHGAALGVSLDGDADRVIFIDEQGEIVDGDQVMAILGTRMLDAGTLRKNTLVATTMSNLGLEKALAAHGGHMVRAQVGDRYVVEEMRRKGYVFGGEQSGHLIFLDQATTGDGLVAALKILEVMVRERAPLSQLKRVMKRYPQVLLNVQVARKPPLHELDVVQRAVHAVEMQLNGEGRVVVRYSGTEMLARVMVEGAQKTVVNRCARSVARALEEACQ